MLNTTELKKEVSEFDCNNENIQSPSTSSCDWIKTEDNFSFRNNDDSSSHSEQLERIGKFLKTF